MYVYDQKAKKSLNVYASRDIKMVVFFVFVCWRDLKKLPSMGNYNLKRDNLVNLKLINTNYL